MVVKVSLEEAWLSEAPHNVRASSHWPDIEKLVHHAAVASPLNLGVLPPMDPKQVMERAGISGVLETMAVSGAGPSFAAMFTNPIGTHCWLALGFPATRSKLFHTLRLRSGADRSGT